MYNLFSKYFHDTDSILSNAEKFKLIKNDPEYRKEYTKKLYDEFIKNQEDYQLNLARKIPNKKYIPKIYAQQNSYQADIMFLDDLKTLNNDYNSILNLWK
jgi:hypothetical protein